MKLTKAALRKIIKEEIGELEFPPMRVSEEPPGDSDSAKLKQISQVVSGVLAKGYGQTGRAMGDALIKISKILAGRLEDKRSHSPGQRPAHAGISVTDPVTGQRMHAKSGPKGDPNV